MVVELNDTSKVKDLFDGWQDTETRRQGRFSVSFLNVSNR